MKNFIRVVSIDCETTSLSHVDGYPWAIGFAWTDYPLDFVVGTIYNEIVYERLIEILIPKAWWNPETYKFCYKHNKDRLDQMAIELHNSDTNISSFTDLIWYLRKFESVLKETVNSAIKDLDKDDYIVVINHPDFDMPFLQQVWPEIKEKGFYYRNIKDMQSLIEGHLGRERTKEYLKARKESFGDVKHTALQDAVDQLKTVIMSGAIKP